MANVQSNRSPSPLPSRNCRNSETNSTTRKSFNGNPFARPNALVNPRDSNLPSPANSPAVTTDHLKRNSIGRRSTGNSAMFKDEKENHIKDVIRSPAKGCSKNFMAPTISAASKFTPSPRKKVLGEKNDLSRASIQFVDKDFDLKTEATSFDQTTKTEEGKGSQDLITLKRKEEVLETTPVRKVTFSLITDATETLSDVTENSDFVKNRPSCCSPITSPIIAPLGTNPSLPPYDPKKNFLSPRPQFLRYKPNPRIEILLNKEYGNDGEDDVTRLDESFNLSDISSDTEGKDDEEKPSEFGGLVHGSLQVSSEKQFELGDSLQGSSKDSSEIVSEEKQCGSSEIVFEEKQFELGDLLHGSSKDSSEIVSEEKQCGSMVVKPSKPHFFTRSKTVSFLFLMFLVACFSVSFTGCPPMDLPIYKDVSFSEIYHESLKFAAFGKESFDDLVENLKEWSMNLVSYLSDQISHFGSSMHGSVQFYNLTTSPIQEEFIFNRHIGTDYTDIRMCEGGQKFEEEMEEIIEDIDEDELDVADEFVTEEANNIQPNELIQNDDDDFMETELKNPEDGLSEIASSPPVSEPASEMVMNEDDVEIESSSADSNVEVSSGTLTSLSKRSINTICLGGFCMVIVAVAAIFHMMKRKSNATKSAAVQVADYDMCRESSSSGSSSVQKRYKKKAFNDKRESLASSSSSDFSTSYGSFTTFERIPIKHGDEVMLTPIRRSSRLQKPKSLLHD